MSPHLRRLDPGPPVRIVHLGLGAFHRAHQAWYTARAPDATEWGILAMTGRRPDKAAALEEQDGLYTLVERSDTGDEFMVVSSIVQARDGADLSQLRQAVASATTALITLTITEAGYHLTPENELAVDSPTIAHDIGELRRAGTGSPITPLGRLVAALDARRRSGAGPIAVVPCDNLAANGEVVRRAIGSFGELVDPSLSGWIEREVSVISTSVDRITPATTPEDVALVAKETGHEDHVPVVTEPFSDWTLTDEFPAGRPRWEDAGARFAAHVEPFERRKLWLLNGAHSLLAVEGLVRGLVTVDQAIADPVCRRLVESWWAEASRHLPDDVDPAGYRRSLLVRFSNRRIAYPLRKIVTDSPEKLRARVLPVLRNERARGGDGSAAALVLAAWVRFERFDAGDTVLSAPSLLDRIEPGLGSDPRIRDVVERHGREVSAS